MNSADDFGTLFKNYVQKYSLLKSTNKDHTVPILTATKKTGANLNEPKQIKATVSSLTPKISFSAPATSLSTACI